MERGGGVCVSVGGGHVIVRGGPGRPEEVLPHLTARGQSRRESSDSRSVAPPLRLPVLCLPPPRGLGWAVSVLSCAVVSVFFDVTEMCCALVSVQGLSAVMSV